MKKSFGHFILQKVQEISEINATLVELRHEKMGCDMIAIINDDEENAFNISLSTFPQNSRGTAHVLEHIVLCGSEHFPVKDPFFAMARRSMNTFMNALTGTDFTCYPAASQIPHDFYNLLKVYLDAVFRPRLLKESFWQEGIHLGFENETLTFKGIVYNEMKGAMSTPDSRLHEKLFEHLMPDLPYRFNSGGNPIEIRELTYEEVKTFHEQYYHPSRALFYFYGNLPLEKHLDFLEEYAFKEIPPLPPLSKLTLQRRLLNPLQITAYYPLTEDQEKKDKTLLSIGYLTTSILQQEELLALHVLDLALMGTDAAPLKSELLKSQLCKQIDSHIEDEISVVPYIITCKGCTDSSSKEIKNLIHKTISNLIEKGIPSHLIEGALHQLELSRTEITGHSFPYGLSLFFRSGLLKQHGGNPSDGLMVHTLFRKLRKKLANPDYISSLLTRHFLQNPHCVEVVLHPQADLSEKEIEEEKAYIKTIVDSLNEEEKNQLKERDKKLLAYQEDEGNLEILPRITLNDVPKITKDFPLIKKSRNHMNIYHHDCFTNDFFYSSLFFDLPDLQEEELPYIHLFTILVTELGCGDRNYKENLNYIFQYTGGIELDLDLFVSCQDPRIMHPTLALRGKALHRNHDKLFILYKDILAKIDFSDTLRLTELLKQHKESLENSIEKHPLRYALSMAASSIYPSLYFQYLWQGFSYYEKARKIINEFFLNPLPFLHKMEEIRKRTLSFSKSDLVMSIPENMFQEIDESLLNDLLFHPKDHFFKPWQSSHKAPPLLPSQGRLISAPLAFIALCFPTVTYTDSRSAPLSIASELMENKVLHKRIREQGGAYGGGSSHSASWGYFHFHSYRDPHLKSTIDAFYEATHEIASGHFNERDLEEAKLCILQVHDAPVFPEHRAVIAYTWEQCGRSKEIRQTYRDRLMKATKKEIQHAVEEILLPGLASGTLVTFAGKDLIEKENSLLKNPLPIFSI